ncbi:MAG: translation initiation factor IF-2, partial [Acidobacteria bacterium]|nr:translation initiation factor IF-2 [Acidobacteriota bacterium]
MKTMSAKFTVVELAKMMGKPAQEVLFLLQGIGVDVKSTDSVLDPGTAQAILTGKTQAPKSLIVRQTPAPGAAPAAPVAAGRAKTERAALKRIKIVEKTGEEEAADGAPSTAESPVSEAPSAVVAGAPATAATSAAPSGGTAAEATPPRKATARATERSEAASAPKDGATTAATAAEAPAETRTAPLEASQPIGEPAPAKPEKAPKAERSSAATRAAAAAAAAAAAMASSADQAAAAPADSASAASAAPAKDPREKAPSAEAVTPSPAAASPSASAPVSPVAPSEPALPASRNEASAGAATRPPAPGPEAPRSAPRASGVTGSAVIAPPPSAAAPAASSAAAATPPVRRPVPPRAAPSPGPRSAAPQAHRSTAPQAAAAKAAAGPAGALGRILKRTGELPARSATASGPSSSMVETSSGAIAGPNTPGVMKAGMAPHGSHGGHGAHSDRGAAPHAPHTPHQTHQATHTSHAPSHAPQAPQASPMASHATPSGPGAASQQVGAPAQAGMPQTPTPAAPPLRGAGGLGRAVIAAPTPQTARIVRAATQPPAAPPQMAPRPGFAPRPGGTFTPRPGGAPGTFTPRPGGSFPPRPGGSFPPRPGGSFPPRPGFGRGPMTPAIPPPALGADKRRKDAKPGSTVVRKDDVKKPASKKLRTKEVAALEEDMRDYLGTFTPDTYDDIPAGGEIDPNKPLSKSAQRRAAKKTVEGESGAVVGIKKGAPTGPVFLSEGVTVKELSDKTGILAKDLMKSFFQRGVFATINQPVDPKVAVEIAREFGIDAAIVSFEEELELSRQQAQIDKAEKTAGEVTDATPAAPAAVRLPRAPVVTVMGHVDHGKTSLLDAIRKADVAAGEAGGITQHIGAYRVETRGKNIVFLDTPGHEAFTMMRSRGAKATDIVVLVVAADDGVMPQTSEAIDHAKAAKVPIVVAINKIDKPESNPGRVKQELAEKGVIVEEFGGDVVSCEISAKAKIGIDQLLDMILLQADLLELKATPEGPARGVVLEARREVGRGTLASVLVQQGTLKVGDVFFAGTAVGRVRAMLDDHGRRVELAGPATPVEVMGFEDIPNAGDTLQVVDDEGKARQVSSFRSQKERDEVLAKSARMSLDSLFTRLKQGQAKDLALIVKADVHGSEEVLVQTLNKLSTEKVKVSVLHSGVGAISVNDVLLASASEAIIIGFNVRPEKKAQELAEKEGVDVRLYSVIYTVTDEIKKAMTGLLDTVKREAFRGRAEVRDTFRVPKIGVIAGCFVLDGVIPRNAGARLVRDGRVVYEGKIGSLRRFKDDAS